MFKMLLPYISNTINKCLWKEFSFVNTDKPYCKEAKTCEKLSPVAQQNSKNSLTAKLPTNVSFVIFH